MFLFMALGRMKKIVGLGSLLTFLCIYNFYFANLLCLWFFRIPLI